MKIIRNAVSGTQRRLGKFSPIVLLFGGMIVGILFWGGFNTTLEASSSMEFCVSCHEMRENVFEEYKETIHYKNASGVQVSCADCHVPKPWIHKIVRKMSASTEIYHSIKGTIDTPEKFDEHRWAMANRVWDQMKATDSRECRNCHSFEGMDYEEQGKSARRKHAKAEDRGETCIECHQGIAHEEPDEPDEPDESVKE